MFIGLINSRDLYNWFTTISLLVIMSLSVCGCKTPPGPYVAKPQQSPNIVYCNDCTGHVPGNKPWIMGGRCCCTPSESVLAQYHKDGFCEGLNVNDLREQYADAGIRLREHESQYSGGLSEYGLHVVLGGNDMVPPTPGTLYYEQIITGKNAVCRDTDKTKKIKAGE